MPSKLDKVAINNPKYDKRVKLTEEDRVNIRHEYQKGGTSYNKLAQKYGVSKRLIQFVVKPEKREKAKEQFLERQKDGRYYDKDRHRKYTQDHRRYKKELYEKGLLNDENDKFKN